MQKLSALIRQGAAQLSLALDDVQVSKALGFLALIRKWNRVVNLTSIDRGAQAVAKHLMDSFAIHRFITGATICDVGSGAGLPGIPLAILFPHKDFILLDSNGRKTSFMTQARVELDLNNITVVQHRVEAWQGEQADSRFDQVVCRAYASLNKIASTTAHLIKPGGSILAMKGATDEPLTEPGYQLERVPLKVPLLQAERQVCILKREPATHLSAHHLKECG